MSAIEKLSQRLKDGNRSELYCPELGESVFLEPMTIRDRKRIRAMNPDGDELDYMVCTVIEKALNRDGIRLFSLEDKDALTKSVPDSFIVRIVDELAKVSIVSQKKD